MGLFIFIAIIAVGVSLVLFAVKCICDLTENMLICIAVIAVAVLLVSYCCVVLMRWFDVLGYVFW